MRLVRLVIEAEAEGRLAGGVRADFFSSGWMALAGFGDGGAAAGAFVFAAARVAAGPGPFTATGGLR